MPLSEEELRLLEQMERALAEEDPKFASTLKGTSFRRSARRRAIVAGIVFVIGVAVLMTGAVLRQTSVGILGFVIMLGSATVGLTAMRGHARAESVQTSEGDSDRGLRIIDGGRSRRFTRRPRSHQSFMERMEERWRKRRENGY